MACPSGKRPHVTREAALEHQKALVYRNHLAAQPERSKGLNVYPCQHCAAWHVGHLDDRVPLVYHYTVGYKLDAILRADALRPRPPKALSVAVNEPNPLLWFSWNPKWEQSVTKDPRPPKSTPPTGRAITELAGEGLIRFAAPASVAKLRWNDYLALNKTPLVQREAMAQRGVPFEWLGTDQPVPLSECRGVEVYYRGHWTPGADVDEADLDRYLEERAEVYADAFDRLAIKLHDAHSDNDNDALALLDRCVPDDDAEAILLDDYRAFIHEENWRRSHLEEIRQWQQTHQRAIRQWRTLHPTRERKTKRRRRG